MHGSATLRLVGKEILSNDQERAICSSLDICHEKSQTASYINSIKQTVGTKIKIGFFGSMFPISVFHSFTHKTNQRDFDIL